MERGSSSKRMARWPGPGQGHPLLLPGELGRVARAYRPPVRGLGPFGWLPAQSQPEPEGHVVENRHGPDGVALEHHAHPAALGWDNPSFVGENAPSTRTRPWRRLQPGHDPERGRLSAAAGPQEGDEAALRDLQGDAATADATEVFLETGGYLGGDPSWARMKKAAARDGLHGVVQSRSALPRLRHGSDGAGWRRTSVSSRATCRRPAWGRSPTVSTRYW